MSEEDIQTTATTLIREYGDCAEIIAGMRHDACLEDGDVDGVIIWGRIVKAVRGLLSQGVPEGAVVH